MAASSVASFGPQRKISGVHTITMSQPARKSSTVSKNYLGTASTDSRIGAITEQPTSDRTRKISRQPFIYTATPIKDTSGTGDHRKASEPTGGAGKISQPPTRKMSQFASTILAGRRLTRWRKISSISGPAPSGDTSSTTPQRTVENTYQLSPKQGRFTPLKVEEMLKEILTVFLDGETYEAKKCSEMALKLSEHIKTRAKKLLDERYKVIAQVMIGQNMGQHVQISSRCIWDTNADNYATANYCSEYIVATAMVFGVYFE